MAGNWWDAFGLGNLQLPSLPFLGGGQSPSLPSSDVLTAPPIPIPGIGGAPGIDFSAFLPPRIDFGGMGGFRQTYAEPPQITLLADTRAARKRMLASMPTTDDGHDHTPSETYDLAGADQSGPMRWAGMAQKYAQESGVPLDVVLGIMQIESGGRADARSPAGASGLMQVMPFHFAPGENPMDPETNLRTGIRILAQNYRRYGNWDSAAAAYLGAVDSSGRPTSSTDVLGTSGHEYVKRFNQARQQYRQALSGKRRQTGTGNWNHIVPGGRGTVERSGSHGGHPAVDIFAPEGTPIYAPVDGISSPGTYSLGGYATTIRGADGRYYYFAHAQRPMYGGTVRKGQVIGYVGRTGNARNTAPHLHYAVATGPGVFGRLNGSGDIDPY